MKTLETLAKAALHGTDEMRQKAILAIYWQGCIHGSEYVIERGSTPEQRTADRNAREAQILLGMAS